MRKIFIRFLSVLTATLISGCAVMQPVATPTGKPEVTIETTDTARIKSALVADVASHGYTLVQDTPYSLAFSKSLDGGDGLLYRAALGNSYSSTPQMNISFTFAPQNGATRVFAHINTSMQNAFGRVDQTNMDRGRAAHQIQALLLRVKSGIDGRRTGSPVSANGTHSYALRVQGKPGYVLSPHAPKKGLVDVRGLPRGVEGRCPFTGRAFLVP